MLQVYLDPCTVNSRKVLAGLDLVGAPYELKHVDYFSGEHKKPEFLAINPNGAVPAVMDGDFALSESNAILQYAADLIGSEKHYPKDLKQRADINRWLLWEASTWFPSCYPYLVEYVVKPLLKTEPDKAIIDKEAPNWHRLAGILDARLATSKWLVGDIETIADIAVAAPMHVHKWQRLPLDDHPNLKMSNGCHAGEKRKAPLNRPCSSNDLLYRSRGLRSNPASTYAIRWGARLPQGTSRSSSGPYCWLPKMSASPGLPLGMRR